MMVKNTLSSVEGKEKREERDKESPSALLAELAHLAGASWYFARGDSIVSR